MFCKELMGNWPFIERNSTSHNLKGSTKEDAQRWQGLRKIGKATKKY